MIHCEAALQNQMSAVCLSINMPVPVPVSCRCQSSLLTQIRKKYQ